MRIILLSLFLFIAGCVSLPTTPESEFPQLKVRINQLEAELTKQKEENLSLRQQLGAAQNVPVRMPTGAEIQAALKNAGFYKGEIDGQIGTRTKEAIKKFQEANGLNPDGVMGSRTWEKLSQYLKPE